MESPFGIKAFQSRRSFVSVSGMETGQVAERLEALGNATRLGIFRLLVQAGPDGFPVGEVQRALDVPPSTLSHHLARLMRVGLVTQERQGRVLICRADFETMNAVIGFLTEKCCAGVEIPAQAGAA